MKAKCKECNLIVRINEHKVFLQHTQTKMNMSTGKLETTFCKGSFKKAFTVQPD